MSIFPKRTVAGSSVTIHWNLTLPPGMETTVCPHVRIGIVSPDGHTHLLFDEPILVLPSTAGSAPPSLSTDGGYQYLNKHTPLLVLASYLAGKASREKLIELLTNIQNGRHYYFTWSVPPDAMPGKYTLLSEMHVDGGVRYSGTAAEDFFFVEQLVIRTAGNEEAVLHNPGPEPVPIKLITYTTGQFQRPEGLALSYLQAGQQLTVSIAGKYVFLVYNEERITVPLHAFQQPRPLRNQQLLSLRKMEAGEAVCYVLPKASDNAYRLTGAQRNIWEAADGMITAQALRDKDNVLYDEMIAHGLITELR
jgi:hypothetical protein